MTKELILERENKHLKSLQIDTIDLLKQLSTQVGTYHGEQIAEHLSKLGDKRYNAKEWDFSDKNGEQ